MQGQSAQAEQCYRQALIELAQLEQSQGVWRETGCVQTDLADVLRDQGDYNGAKAAYQVGLTIAQELGDTRSVAVVTGQLGTLAYVQGELAEAAERHKESLSLFRSIGEPAGESVGWHQLGLIHQKAKHWEQAEQAYRQAARLREEQGLLGGNNGAGSSWGPVASLCEATGRLAEAEQWYRKALAAFKEGKDWPHVAVTLGNLAILLANNPAHLDKARGLAEEGLAIFETLDPAAAEIWKNYYLLARITSQQGESSQAAAYRAKSRKAYFAFPAWRQQLWDHEELIAAVVQSGDAEAALAPYGEVWANLKAAIRRLLSGERNEAALCEPLGWQEAAIIRAILEGIGGVR
jgi:Tfp pilus assembly protein PilF